MRTFVCVDIGDAVSSALDAVRAELGAPPHAGDAHITLAFLGEIDERQASDVGSRLDSIVFEPFKIGIASLGAFPSRANPRIVWAGAGAGSDKLRALAASVDGAIAPLGFARRQRFVPHITVFRVKSRSGRIAGVLEKHQNTVFGTHLVDAISLKRSDLRGGRHVHTILHTAGAAR